jgi:hypothetical protein
METTLIEPVMQRVGVHYFGILVNVILDHPSHFLQFQVVPGPIRGKLNV